MTLTRKPIGRTARGPAALSLAAGALAVTVAACGSPAPSASTPSHLAGSPSPHMSEHMSDQAMTIGTDCGMIPSAGMGSVHGMASEPVATAASHDPLVTTLAAEVQKAGLTGVLNSAHGITVFAPDNQAFSSLSAHDMSMMSGQAELAKVLDYHVVRGQVTPADFARGMTLTTLEGSQLTISKMGATYEVNNAPRLPAGTCRPPTPPCTSSTRCWRLRASVQALVTAWSCASGGSPRQCGPPHRAVVPAACRSAPPAEQTPPPPDRE